MSPRDLPRFDGQSDARAPGELLGELRLRLDRLAASHPSSSASDRPAADADESVVDGNGDDWMADDDPDVPVPEDRTPPGGLTDERPSRDGAPAGHDGPAGALGGQPGSAASDHGFGSAPASRAGQPGQYRPWFMDAEPSAPWFVTGEDL